MYKKTAKIHTLIRVIFLTFFLIINTLYAQKSCKINNIEYRLHNGKWYSYNGKLCDEVVESRLIVRLKNKGKMENFNFNTIDLKNISLATKSFLGGFYVLSIPEEINSFEVAKKLEKTGLFDVIEFDCIGRFHGTPNDDHFPDQWNLDATKLQMEKAWGFTTGDSTIIVAVIDQGTFWQHEDLVDNVWQNLGEDADGDGHTIEKINGEWQYDPGDINNTDDDGNGQTDDFIGWNFFTNSNNITPCLHGTAVSGIVSAKTNNNIGISGVAGGWNEKPGVKIMPIQIGPEGGIWPSLVDEAIEYAVNNGTDVINLSLGWSTRYTNIQVAVALAYANNCIVIYSAGNKGNLDEKKKHLDYPTIQDDSRYYRSSIGDELKILDVMSPGGHSIWSTMQNGGYTSQMGGTSASAPHVSGLAGLILSLNPGLTFDQVRTIIRNTADKVAGMNGQNYTDYYGYGRINAYEALKYTLRHYGGTLKGDVVLHKALILEPGVTLTILPGTTIKIDGYYNIIAKAGSKIIAEGTEENPITFTSLNGTSPSSWKNIFLYGSGSKFEHCIFKYGNWAVNISGYPNTSGQNIIKNCTFYHNDQALRIQNNNSTIVENCKIYDNRHGIVTTSVSDLDFTGNRIRNNKRDGVYSIGNSDLAFVYNVIDYNGEGHYSTCNGIYSCSSDHITLYNPTSSKNTIRNNYSKEIYADYGTPIVDLGNPVHGGNNAVFDSLHTNDAEIYNRSGNPAISILYTAEIMQFLTVFTQTMLKFITDQAILQYQHSTAIGEQTEHRLRAVLMHPIPLQQDLHGWAQQQADLVNLQHPRLMTFINVLQI